MEIIRFEEAYETVMNSAFTTGTEKVELSDSLDRTLAFNVVTDIDMPPFTRSSVDGFACRRAELENELEVIETIPAGKAPGKAIGKGQCSKIMTGAPVPEGADCIIMIEETEELSSGMIRFTGKFKKENISYRASDIKAGEVVLKSGRIIKPQDIAVLAAAGQVRVVVARKPKIAVISSGSELVEPDTKPLFSQIRNTNSYQLMAQVEKAGAVGRYYGIAKDDEEETFSILSKAAHENDVVIITGGVSMGDFDFVPAVIQRSGFRILFSQIAVQPGKPTTFGIKDKCVIFGLPGNPVSSFLQFELLVRPLLSRMTGSDWKPLELLLPMKEEFIRKYAERMALIPVTLTNENKVSPVEFHGSAHISAMSQTFGIVSLPIGKLVIDKGEIVNVRQV
jgi:molybdopterin molybdotransferase